MLKQIQHFQTNDSPMESSGYFKRAWHRYLERVLPRKIKRLIFISTIMALVKKIQEPNMAHIDKMNDIFKVSRDSKAFLMPMKVKNVIWKNTRDKQLVCPTSGTQSITELLTKDHDSDDYRAIGEFFAMNAPIWLQYGSKELMINDASLLIKQMKKLET